MDKLKPWITSIVLLPVVIWLTINEGKFIFLVDHFNLLIHEGGHGIFSLFGQFVYTLGGTLMQILLPLLFVYYFVSHRKRIGLQISFIWLGQNLMNISVYAADARERSIPLLGGNKVYHDWHFLLVRTGLLQYDDEIGTAFYLLGIIVLAASILIPLFMKEYTEAKIDLGI